MTNDQVQQKYKQFEQNINKLKNEMIPKAENLERDLELLDGKDTQDDDFVGKVDKLNSAMKKSKELVSKREQEKKKKVE